MSIIQKQPATTERVEAETHVASARRAGPYMLTLSELSAPIEVPQPQSAQLKPFKFFLSRHLLPGGERFRLHMGYFATLAEAQLWQEKLRGLYPDASACAAPSEARQQPGQSALTDTQVLHILEKRRAGAENTVADAREREISLLRPDDTSTRRHLKEAVTQNAPVSFAVQLQWSVQPIDLHNVPSLAIFRAYTLYSTQGHREGRTWYCLRLGFFSDAISAKQVALHLRAYFASVAVVPIGARERAHAGDCRIKTQADAPAPERTSQEARVPQPEKFALPAPRPSPAANASAQSAAPPRAAQKKKDSLEETLEMLASELFIDDGRDDTLNDTGVRHLQVEVKRESAAKAARRVRRK